MPEQLVHTLDPILHPGAREDFEIYLRALVEDGKTAAALELWQAVAEVQHMPVPEAPMLQGFRFPPLATVPCTATGCQRCEGLRSGFQFPWLGPWTRQGVLLQPGCTPQSAWERWSSSTAHLDALQLQIHGSGHDLAKLIPPYWARVLERCSAKPGCASRNEVFSRWRDWQEGSPIWIDPRLGPVPTREQAKTDIHMQAQRAMLEWMAADPVYLLPTSCRRCGSASRNICADCFHAVCQQCELEAEQRGFPAICCPEMGAGESRRFPAPALQPGQPDVDVFRAIMGLPLRGPR